MAEKSPLSGTVDSWIFWVERHSVEIPGGEIHVTTAPRSLGEVIWGWTRDEIHDLWICTENTCFLPRDFISIYHIYHIVSRILYNMPYDHHALYNITMSVIKIPHVVARHQSFRHILSGPFFHFEETTINSSCAEFNGAWMCTVFRRQGC